MGMQVEVFFEKPSNFKVDVEVAGCFCKSGGEILLLKRADKSPQGGTWNIPAGKVEMGESYLDAAIREVNEETGIILPFDITSVGVLYITIPDCSYAFHMFYHYFDRKPPIVLDEEEQVEACWTGLKKARKLPLIAGGREALEFFTKFLDISTK